MGENQSLHKKNIIVISGILILSLLTVILSASAFVSRPTDDVKITAEDLSKKLIRLHVIANSDSPEDQALKLEVRDEIIKVLNTRLEGVEDIEESRRYIKDNLNYLEEVARRTIHKKGKNYSVKAVFGRFPFPIKTYGYVTLPAGDYEALRVKIGSGSGANWWCVLFPPLCFVDITKDVGKHEAQISLGKYLTPEELKAIETTIASDAPVEVRFKVAEWWESAKGNFNKIKFALR